MKFTLPRQPVHNETRERKWFAILPVKIGRHVRWLETVRVRQVYQNDGINFPMGSWRNSFFLK